LWQVKVDAILLGIVSTSIIPVDFKVEANLIEGADGDDGILVQGIGARLIGGVGKALSGLASEMEPALVVMWNCCEDLVRVAN
jgi:hypothetical protein